MAVCITSSYYYCRSKNNGDVLGAAVTGGLRVQGVSGSKRLLVFTVEWKKQRLLQVELRSAVVVAG